MNTRSAFDLAVGACCIAAVGATLIGSSILYNGWGKTMFDYGIKSSNIEVLDWGYGINYRSKKVGNMIFRRDKASNTSVLIVGNTSYGHLDKDDINGILLQDNYSNGIIDFMIDAKGRYHRPANNMHCNLEKRFLKADRLFSSLTSEGELADLIKKAETEWREKHAFDPLNEYIS